MNLLDIFKKSKKTSPSCYLGKMWALAVKFTPWAKSWYGVVIAETDITEAYVRNGETQVVSSMRNPFNKGDSVSLRGPVGHLEYVSPSLSYQWIGFFETKDEAKEEYRRFADALVAKIESAPCA